MCHQIPHGTWDKFPQLLCLILGPLRLSENDNPQGRILPLTLVTICYLLTDLHTGGGISGMQRNPICDISLVIFGTLFHITSILEFLRSIPSQGIVNLSL